VVAPGAGGATTAWFRPHETELATDGPGLEITVTDVLNKGGLVRVECRTPGGQLLEVDRPRAAGIVGLVPGASLRLRPTRVFLFPEMAAN
jgi:sulfate transport system ATP-binding protein